jgi:hypothetical protein
MDVICDSPSGQRGASFRRVARETPWHTTCDEAASSGVQFDGNRWCAVRVILLVVFLVGCGTARPLMPVPASLEETSVMTVQRHGWGIGPKPLSFGEWDVVDYHKDRRPTERRRAVSVSPITYSQTKGTAAYSFVLAPNGRDAWECYCEHRRDHQDVGIGSVESPMEVALTYDESLECELQRVGDEEVWKLQVIGSLAIGGEGYTGTLRNGSHTVTLQASHGLAKFQVPGPPTGYIFEREGVKVASTELLMPGFVRIGEDAGEDRDAIATAAAALLMQPSAM